MKHKHRVSGPAFAQLRTKGLTVLWAVALLLAPPPALVAQINSPGPPPSQQLPAAASAEAKQIDALIAECRQQMSQGNFEGIAEKAREALALSQRIEDKIRQSRSLMYVALGMFHTGQTEQAIDPFKQSAALAGEAGDSRLQSLALNSAGVLLEEAGRYEEALYFYHQSLALCRAQKDRRCEPGLLRNVGLIHVKSRDYLKADEILKTSLALSRTLNEPSLEYGALMVLGSLENSREQFEAALDYQMAALKLESAATRDSSRYQLRNQIAISNYELDRLDKAADFTMQALELARKNKVAAAEATVLGNLANLQLKQGKVNEALNTASEALALLRQTGGDPGHEATILFTQAQAQKSLGHPEESLSNLKQAMSRLERGRSLFVPTEEARAEFVAGNSYIFVAAIDLLLSLGKTGEALAVSESYHARAFLDLLVESRADLRRVLPKDLLDKEDGLLKRISDTQRELWQEGISGEREQDLKRELAAREAALEEFHLNIRQTNPQYAGLTHLQPLTTERIQRELLDADTALLEYVAGAEKSYAWLVSKNKIAFIVLPSQKELHRLVTEYRQAITERLPGPAAKQSLMRLDAGSRQLYQILIQPFDKQLSSFRKLIIVPDHALAYLPFEALAGSRRAKARKGQYLVERFAIGYAPSASALAAVRSSNAGSESRSFIAFADPAYRVEIGAQERSPGPEAKTWELSDYLERGFDLRRLPYTRTEATNIAALFPAGERKVFLGTDANEQQVKSEPLARYRYLHFAAHGIVDEENPARSGVILSLGGNQKDDGILQMSEIMRLKLNADLVTLSACRTGMGKVVGGEGVLGLTRAFLYAGTRSVVASLWNVNDTATAELMTTFYQNLRRGLAKDEALRQAKLRLLHGRPPTWRHPFYWAPFVLVGANN